MGSKTVTFLHSKKNLNVVHILLQIYFYNTHIVSMNLEFIKNKYVHYLTLLIVIIEIIQEDPPHKKFMVYIYLHAYEFQQHATSSHAYVVITYIYIKNNKTDYKHDNNKHAI